jgi:chemotaxis protein histidine kinase CheA
MVKSLLNRFNKPRKTEEAIATVDLSRVVGTRPPDTLRNPQSQPAKPKPEIDLETWKQNDLDRLATCWTRLNEAPESEEAYSAFQSIVHNLHGASGAYGGGALTDLTGSLQRLLNASTDLKTDQALINLHVQACRAAGLGQAAEDVAEAVCNALEAQVDARVNGWA